MTSRDQQGFTLIEVLVALAIMAMMAIMSWRGIESMWQTQSTLQERSNRLRTVQTALAQWQVDLDKQSTHSQITPWDWDGKVMRLTREGFSPTDPLRVVAWSWEPNPVQPNALVWKRWQSTPILTLAQWQTAWDEARTWSQTPTAALRQDEIQLFDIGKMQLFVSREGSWSNPLSSDTTNGSQDSKGQVAPPPRRQPAEAIRLILDVRDPSLEGTITLDWLSPIFTGKRT